LHPYVWVRDSDHKKIGYKNWRLSKCGHWEESKKISWTEHYIKRDVLAMIGEDTHNKKVTKEWIGHTLSV